MQQISLETWEDLTRVPTCFQYSTKKNVKPPPFVSHVDRKLVKFQVTTEEDSNNNDGDVDDLQQLESHKKTTTLEALLGEMR